MRIVHGWPRANTNIASRAHLTIGIFDGVHRGHQKLIRSMIEVAHLAGDSAVTLTFDPHPASVLGNGPPPLLTTVEERAQLLADLGLDCLVVLAFTPELARTTATDFVESLDRHLDLVELWGGADLALGHRREGNLALLRCLGAERGFAVRVVEPSKWRGEVVSSSRVRDALMAGDIPEATGCLGRPYRLTGVVVQGNGLGHQIGVPTANLAPPSKRLIPANGVYACLGHTERGETYQAVTNVGTRPTFTSASAEPALVAEAHLLDFDDDLYGQTLAVDFIARLRDERPFSTLNALVTQIREDIDQARRILEEN